MGFFGKAFTFTGKVIQRAESIVSGTTEIHLAVQVSRPDREKPQIIAFSGSSRFAMLPLARVGDVVRFSCTEYSYIKLEDFDIEWEHSPPRTDSGYR